IDDERAWKGYPKSAFVGSTVVFSKPYRLIVAEPASESCENVMPRRPAKSGSPSALDERLERHQISLIPDHRSFIPARWSAPTWVDQNRSLNPPDVTRLWTAPRGPASHVGPTAEPQRAHVFVSYSPAALTQIPKSGMMTPILGMKARFARFRRKSLADALFTKTQQRVLGVLFGQPERSFYASELIRDAGTGSGAAQRELAKLEGSGLISARRIGHQKHYQANAASPLYSELRNIVLKTVGLAEPLRDALKPLSSAIRAAFVYGSVAKATDQSASDIDLMIISDSLTYGEVFGALERVTRAVGRKVNPTVYT